MSQKDLKTLTEKRDGIQTKRFNLIQEMHDLTEKTSFPAEAQNRWNEIDVEQKALETEINTLNRTLELQEEMRSFQKPPANQPGVVPGAVEGDIRTNKQQQEDVAKRAFETYVRRGIGACEAQFGGPETRTYTGLNTGSGSQGDFTVPVGFQKELETKMKAYGGMLTDARVILTASGNEINWPTVDDTANKGRWLTENSPVSQTNPTFGQVNLSSNLASSDQVLISVQLLNDSAFDLQSELTDMFAIRLGRLVNDGYTSGNGTGQPNGILTALGSTNQVTVVGDPQTGNTADNSVGYDDLINLQFAVDAAYRNSPQARYHFSDNTFKAVRKLKDSLGRPLWQASMAGGAPDSICDKQYTVNYSMPDIASGHTSVLFGDFNKYIIRNVGPVTLFRFNETFMSNHQIGFQAFLRTDGQLLQAAAFGTLIHP
jgi:HK97 family phage major capsid protein